MPADPNIWKFDATPEEIRAQYERARKEITDEELLRGLFTEEPGRSLDEVIQEIEAAPNEKEEASR
jgi:hypothetical protein